jgi:hypothetical protein
MAHSVTVATLRGSAIKELDFFLTPALVERFGLPDQLRP